MAKKDGKDGKKKSRAKEEVSNGLVTAGENQESLVNGVAVVEVVAAGDLSDGQAYIAKMQAERGYILDWHKVLAEHDFEFLKGYNSLLNAAYTNQRLLDVKTKEMLITAVLMAVRSQPDHIKTHLEMCKKFGVTAQEMLEVLEVVLPPAGVPAFIHSFDLWRQVYGIE